MNPPELAIVMAAGEGSRWGDYLGVPKHLVPHPDSSTWQTLLNVTVEKLSERLPEVWVVARNDDRYRNHTGHTLTVDPRGVDTDKFLSSERLWMGRDALLVYGDCYLSEAALDEMCSPRAETTLYGRFHGSELTGCEWGECFGFYFAGYDSPRIRERLTWLTGAFTLGDVGRCGGWELFRALGGQPLTEHRVAGPFIEIDDWSEDFDYPADYDLWMARRAQSTCIR